MVDDWQEVANGLQRFVSGDWSTLLVAADWAQHHCVVPDGFRRGEWFEYVDWQLWSLLNWYRVKPGAVFSEKPAEAFLYRRSQIVGPQKCGKAPYTASHICIEGVGPAVFAGWARGGEVYDCRDHGCGCGWKYEYQPGEAMGRRWPTPLIQITAFSEKQTDNIYSALRPMIDDGPLHDLVPKTGEEMIRLPGGGRIDVVTSEARSRLGARVTFVPQDETGIWTESAKMVTVARTQRRGAAVQGGRVEETTNAWDPNQGSVAQMTAEDAEKVGDIFRWHPRARGLSYRNKAERRKIHAHVYRGCRWASADLIEAESAEIMVRDPGEAERFYGNNPTAGAGVAFDAEVVKSRKAVRPLPPSRAPIVIGVDGALMDDALAMVATDVATGFAWPLAIIERPENASNDYRHDLELADGAMVEAMERWNVWRVYIDDQWIDRLVERWTNRWGSKRIVVWRTNRPQHMAWAVRELEDAIASPTEDYRWSYNGDERLEEHFANAQKAEVNVLDDKERPMHILAKDSKDSPRKKDGADAAVLAWKARSDAIEKGVVRLDGQPETPAEPEQKPRHWTGGVPALGEMANSGEALPAGFMG